MKLKSLTKNQVNFSLSCRSCFASATLSGVDLIYRSHFGAYFFHFQISYSVAYDFLALVIDALVFNVSNNVDLSAHMAMSLRRAYDLHLLLHLSFCFFLLLFFRSHLACCFCFLILLEISQDRNLPVFSVTSNRL